MHMAAVQPGQLTVEEIRAQYPVAIDDPTGGLIRTAEVVIDPNTGAYVHPMDLTEQPKIFRVPLATSPASVQPPDEWHAPLLYPAPLAPGTQVMEIDIIPPWVWIATTVGLLGLLLWRAR